MSEQADAAQNVLAALAAGAVDVLDRLHARDYVDHSPFPGQSSDITGPRERAMVLSSALVDSWVDSDVLIDDGDTVVCSTRTTGVHKGSFLGIPATGRRVEMVGITVFRFVDGLVAESWSSFEVQGMFDGITAGRARPAGASAAPRHLAPVACF
jgi:predicted ester cyclase